MSPAKALDAMIIRGGTSRGVVLRLDQAPPIGPERDHLARTLIGNTPVAGLGGGNPISNKVVLVGASQSATAELDYIVGNVSSDGTTVDWSGTCGNMTSAVVPFAYTSGLVNLPSDPSPTHIRNLATGGLIAVTLLSGAGGPPNEGDEVRMSTSFLFPGGAVLGQTLPTGLARNIIEVDSESFDLSVVDVTHPYLLLSYGQVIGDRNVDDPETAARIELIRGSICVQLGLCSRPEEAREALPAVPRVVLIHEPLHVRAEVRITAISMGQPISSVPVTAALSLAAARSMGGTIIGGAQTHASSELRVTGPSGALRAQALVDGDGRVLSASLERTARILMRGRICV